MTTDLSSKSVEELAAYFGQIYDQACNSIVAFDELARRLEEAQQQIVAQQALIQDTIHRIPAIVDGEMIIDHHDSEGEFIGSESVDPLAVIGFIVGEFHSTMEFSALAAHDAKLTAEAKAEALTRAAMEFGSVSNSIDQLYVQTELLRMAAEYRAKAGRNP